MSDVLNNEQRTSAEKKSPVWHCLVKFQVIFCIATTVTIVLTPHRQIVAVEAFSIAQENPGWVTQSQLSVGSQQATEQQATEQQVTEQQATEQQDEKSSTPNGELARESQTVQRLPQGVAQQEQQKISKKRQEQLLEFVKSHHPQLVKLLQHLKKNRRDEYNKAMIELDRAEQRISLYEDKNPQRYQIELNLWKSRSRIRMLVAQLSVKENPQQQRQLRQEVKRFYKLREDQLLSDKQRLEERVKRVDETLEKLNTQRDDLVERQFQSYLRNAQRQRNQNERDKNPQANKKNADRANNKTDRQKNANNKKDDGKKDDDKKSADDE